MRPEEHDTTVATENPKVSSVQNRGRNILFIIPYSVCRVQRYNKVSEQQNFILHYSNAAAAYDVDAAGQSFCRYGATANQLSGEGIDVVVREP